MQRPTKKQIQNLPLFVGVGLENIHVITNAVGAKNAVEDLRTHTCLGFDTESKPCFIKGEVSTGPHIVQIASDTNAYIFPTQFLSNIEVIKEILNDETIKKVGFGLQEDKKHLHQRFGISLENTEDLSVKVKNFTKVKQNVGMRVAVAMLLNKRLSKGAQKSNWSRFPLTTNQLMYAANDAYASLCIEREIALLLRY